MQLFFDKFIKVHFKGAAVSKKTHINMKPTYTFKENNICTQCCWKLAIVPRAIM